jgi:DNA-binding response OmpR family regulator
VSESTETPSILIVDDEREVADVYSLRLESEYDVEVAYGGQEALDRVSEATDVVLLDRRMPDLSGDEVLDRIRERGLDTRVIMLTAVDPDFDILDMPFDDYLCKPVEKADLVGAINQQLSATRYDDQLSEYLNVTSKLGLLEQEKTARELDENEEITQLRQRAAELQAEMDDALGEFKDADAAFQALDRNFD